MATTTNFGWETPDDTDLVKDGAAAMRTLGNSIDTSFVDLKGGTTGQVLSKASNTDLDFTWVTDAGDIAGVTAGTGISGGGTSGTVTITNSMATTIDAKGDLIAGTGADAFDRLAVGTNGQVLTADSTAATGLKWAAAGSAFSGCSVYSTSSQSISNGSTTILTFDSENFDTSNYHSTSSNTGRLTVPNTGKYLIFFKVTYEGNTTGIRQILMKKNGTTDIGYIYAPAISVSSTGASSTLTQIVDATAGDYFTISVYQTSGGTLSVLNSLQDTFFGIQYLGA